MGPRDAARKREPEALLSEIAPLANEAGITRLADVTRLDRIGLPVWQAVRPISCALSVHQGKGASQAAAQLGALVEGIESDCAERFDEEGPFASWMNLAQKERPADLGDFARDRDNPLDPTEKIRWAETERHEGGKLFVPFECVSLDFTLPSPSLFERNSAGLASGADPEEAKRVALLELIERDAAGMFGWIDIFERMEREIEAETIPFDWFGELTERIEAIGGYLQCFHMPSLTSTPVIGASIHDPRTNAFPYRAIAGHAAHPEPEQALFQAVAEAIQGRATYIAGARDDCLPSHYTQKEESIAFALAPPAQPWMDQVDFGAIEPGPSSLDDLVAELDAAGFEGAAFAIMKETHALTVCRAFAPGLASLSKMRRS